MNETSFENQCSILSEIFLEYRDDANFADFISYNDLGLPLAYAISSGIVARTEKAASFIEEAWMLLLAGLDVEDTGFEELDELFAEGTSMDMDFDDEEDEEEDFEIIEEPELSSEEILEMIKEEKNAWGYGTQACKALEQLQKRILEA